MLTVITAPAVEPVSLEEAKSHLRIDADIAEHDGLLELLIQAAREQAEHETGRSLITRELLIQDAATCRLSLHKPPFLEITSVTLIADNETETVLNAADYRVDKSSLLPVLLLKNGTNNARDMRVAYTAGYGTSATAVPAAIRRWMLMHIATHFENRESVVVGTIVTAMPTPFIDGLLDPFRINQGF